MLAIFSNSNTGKKCLHFVRLQTLDLFAVVVINLLLSAILLKKAASILAQQRLRFRVFDMIAYEKAYVEGLYFLQVCQPA